ncbi:Hypp5456 [Branchiostoma lanceolatum]|uniref:Hypp5456 protein n=1 Tax=Branchiostoma lanceolatum TaxID=7740 RepID=A0A8J9YQW7_BRALA|nr:Hypp5456 [Branchiostoma lanceolatum]
MLGRSLLLAAAVLVALLCCATAKPTAEPTAKPVIQCSKRSESCEVCLKLQSSGCFWDLENDTCHELPQGQGTPGPASSGNWTTDHCDSAAVLWPPSLPLTLGVPGQGLVCDAGNDGDRTWLLTGMAIVWGPYLCYWIYQVLKYGGCLPDRCYDEGEKPENCAERCDGLIVVLLVTICLPFIIIVTMAISCYEASTTYNDLYEYWLGSQSSQDPRFKKRLGRGLFFPRTIKEWSEFEPGVAEAGSLSQFKTGLGRTLLH